MAVSYSIVLTDPFGEKLKDIIKYISCQYARKINDIGAMTLVLPREYDIGLFISAGRLRVDNRIEVWRQLHGGPKYLDSNAAWFINDFYEDIGSDGKETYVIKAVDAIDLLDRRIIPYNEGMELLYADKVGYADDMMKEIIDENYGSSALDSDRDLSDWIIIQADASAATSIMKSFSRRNVLKTLREIADTSLDYGTPLMFDLIYRPSDGKFEFQTFVNQRGVDRTSSSGANPVIVSAERGTLSDVKVRHDHSKSKNFIYAGGQSVGQIRAVWEESDGDSIALSPFNRRELFVNASDTDDDDELEDEAKFALSQNKSVVSIEGTLIDRPKLRYGREYDLGWKITAEYANNKYDVYVAAVSIKLDNSGEEVNAVLRSEF